MNDNTHSLAILALALTSLVVRIVPVFIRINMTPVTTAILERALPCAVFLTFAIYICVTEIQNNAMPAIAAIALTVILVFTNRMSLIFTALLGSLTYFAVQLAMA